MIRPYDKVASLLLRHALNGKAQPLVWDLNLVAANRCNQACPMCNAGVLSQPQSQMICFDTFRKYTDMLAPLEIPVCTISGGEPTIVPDMPRILDEAASRFPVEVMLISNFYTKPTIIQRVMEAALCNNVHVICSFDGFGEVADRLRGAPNVSQRVCQNMELVTSLKREMHSQSILEVHTVLSDENLDEVGMILAMSRDLGWVQTVAPLNSPPQIPRPSHGVGLTYSPKLDKVVDEILKSPNVRQLHAYIKGVPEYARGTHKRHCPYLTSGIQSLKIFLEPNGDVSLCDRKPIGNLNQAPLGEILQGPEYNEFVDRARACEGCWLSCFTEPALAIQPAHMLDALVHRAL